MTVVSPHKSTVVSRAAAIDVRRTEAEPSHLKSHKREAHHTYAFPIPLMTAHRPRKLPVSLQAPTRGVALDDCAGVLDLVCHQRHRTVLLKPAEDCD